jgi:hypothetical protein
MGVSAVTVILDNGDYQVIRTTSPAGYVDTLVWKANTPGANAQTLRDNIAAALVRLRQIETQAATFVGQAPYAAANLTNLNDLLAKAQLIAQAVNDIAGDLIGIARIMSNNYDGTG